MRNTINIGRSIGLIFFGIGAVLGAATIPDVYRNIVHPSLHYNNDLWDGGIILIPIISIAFLVTGVLGLFRLSKFHLIGKISLIFAIIAFAIIYFTNIFPEARGRDTFLVLAVGLIGFGLLMSFFVMFHSLAFREALDVEDEHHKLSEDILDQEDF